VAGLTAREREIVRLVALGHTSREIAERLVLSVRTVETHRGRIHKRLNVSSRAELVRWALEQGLLAP
jgi:two-component system response regulator NreC